MEEKFDKTEHSEEKYIPKKTWEEINMEEFDAGYYQRHGLIQYLIRNYDLPTKK